MESNTVLMFDVPHTWRKQWPCGCLSGCHVAVELDKQGNLVDLSVDHGAVDTCDLEAAELNACLELYGKEN